MTVVLDASAVLAFLQDENGSDRVLEVLPDACMSVVNRSEVLTVLQRAGGSIGDAQSRLDGLIMEFATFDQAQADFAAEIAPQAEKLGLGLGLGGRACVALAAKLSATAITAERKWLKLDAGVAIENIREQVESD